MLEPVGMSPVGTLLPGSHQGEAWGAGLVGRKVLWVGLLVGHSVPTSSGPGTVSLPKASPAPGSQGSTLPPQLWLC